ALGCSGLLLVMAACSGGKSTQKTQTAATPPPAVVFTTVTPQTVPIYGEYVGQTEAADTVEIHAQVTGFLQQIAFKEGSIVHKGQLLFVIDPRPYEAALDQAKATLAVDQATVNNAQKIVNRYKPLVQETAISKQDFDSAVATAQEDASNVKLAQAQVSAAQLNVNYTRIQAPMTGSIGTSQVKVGDLVQSGTTLLDTIYSISPMYVTFAISEADYLAYLKRGRQHPHHPPPIQLILGNGSTYDYPGTINMVAPTVSTTTGTLGIRASFPNPQRALKPGLFGRVRFVVREAVNAFLVPQSAVQQLQGTESVLLVGPDNKVQQSTVTTGATVGNLEIVSSGLKAGDRVIVEGIQKAQPGMAVQAKETPEETASAITAAEEKTPGKSSAAQSGSPTPASSSAAPKSGAH
ncbi:MAG: efflux RND transporter periplasmic adaptor subunit, partial [Bryobacteraceae bacterium]